MQVEELNKIKILNPKESGRELVMRQNLGKRSRESVLTHSGAERTVFGIRLTFNSFETNSLDLCHYVSQTSSPASAFHVAVGALGL